ncbi:hypothetical protein BH09VER1_BH09VER1_42980 [soil metagenome]
MKLVSSLLMVGASLCAADVTIPLENANFENGLNGWKTDGGSEGVSCVVSEAALLGKFGLRLFTAKPERFTTQSRPIPVTPGKTYTVDFWSGGSPQASPVEVKMVFHGPTGEELSPAMAKIRKWPAISVKGGTFANAQLLAAAAPEGAATLTVGISSSGKTAIGPVWLDDFRITELSDEPPPEVKPGEAHPVPASDPARLKALEKEIAENPYRGKSPPKIVLKLDDFGASHGGVHNKWLKVAEFAKARKIKITFGIIANRMTEECPEFVKWTKAEHDAGRIEFWLHGWDHGERKEGTKRIMEFSGESLHYQKKHLADANALAREKLGFSFVSFGAPFNGTDENTVRALDEDPDIKVWIYGDPDHPGGKTVLERCGSVSIESPTLIPNYGDFLEGYAHNRGAKYFVMQGHPAGWNDERWEQFVKIVDFLIAQKAEFVFASELAGPTSR